MNGASLKLVRYFSSKIQSKFDAVIIGAGHNGLVCGAYLAQAGKRVCILERRCIVGGAAVTEVVVPGFKFSRASYVLGLLRPQIIKDLQLEKYGLKVHRRNPSSYTPLLEEFLTSSGGRSLVLGEDMKENCRQIAQFSKQDAERYPEYERLLRRCAAALPPLLDAHAPPLRELAGGGLLQKLRALPTLRPLLQAGRLLDSDLPLFIELLTAPSSRVLDSWFNSEPLKATLATDSVIGAMISPATPGSGYVLLHHVMAETGGEPGAWGYPEGGMGAVTQAMARSAESSGAQICLGEPVSRILLSDAGVAEGVETESGRRVYGDTVLSNATPDITLLRLLPRGTLPHDYEESIRNIDYTSPVCKINVALSGLPNFLSDPSSSSTTVMPHHRCTIHLNCEHSGLIDEAYRQAQRGLLPDKPLIELTLPSSLDPTLAPPGHHVGLIFTQYTPYTLAGATWDERTCTSYAETVFACIEQYAPGFRNSVLGYEVLPPPELERVFGLTGGNIFHGAMSLDRLYWSRPCPQHPGPQTPVPRLLLCGSGAHPGGGVMGSPGRLAARAVLEGKF